MTPAILLDPTSDIDLFQASELGVDLLLQTVEFMGEKWLDAAEISGPEMFAALRAGAPPPTTIRVTPDAYSSTLERMLTRSNHVFALHPNRYAHSILDVARQAAGRFPGRVTVYDAQTISAPMAILAERAARAFAQGASPQQVAGQLDLLRSISRVTMLLETTEFLPPQSILAPDLARLPPGAKPLLGLPGGDVRVLGHAPSSTVALSLMRQRVQQKAKDFPGGEVVFSHRDAPEQVAVLERTARNLGIRVRFTTTLGLVVSSNVGPGAYAFGMFPRPE
ncbi:DegV family protein [Deinococcus lacus]|uniref:DegV family protein n=1 Tax=Deinococcus lacus TaxID=392561 RepID=A0ABW1YES1_9DEIO